MKTTLDIADPLLARAKALAARERTTLRAIVEGALRDALDAKKTPHTPSGVTTQTFGGRGLQKGLSWDDWEKIRELSYEGRGG